MKLDNYNIESFLIKRVFFNLLIIELNLLDSIKIHFVFHISLFQYAVQDSLFDQIPEPRDFVVIEENEQT